MKIYVAGMWNATAMVEINEVQQSLVNTGHTITHDWTHVEGTLEQTTFSSEDRDLFRTKCATLDIDGVKSADLVFAIMKNTTYPYRGTFTELGCAMGLDKQIVIVCPGCECACYTNCFFHYPGIKHVTTIEEGLAYINTISK
jgi:nucleoside 2-deoxyribosyltransferase